MSKIPIEPIVEVESNPEVAVPFAVGYRVYEIGEGLSQIYDASQGQAPIAPQQARHQPFFRGSQVNAPPPNYVPPHLAPTSGGVQPTSTSTYSDAISRISESLGNMREETKDYGDSSATIEPFPRLSTGELDYEGVLANARQRLSNIARINQNISLIEDRRRVENLRRRVVRPGEVGG